MAVVSVRQGKIPEGRRQDGRAGGWAESRSVNPGKPRARRGAALLETLGRGKDPVQRSLQKACCHGKRPAPVSLGVPQHPTRAPVLAPLTTGLLQARDGDGTGQRGGLGAGQALGLLGRRTWW